MTNDERERIREDVGEYAAQVLDLSADFAAHLMPWNDWPQDQHEALLDKVRRFGWYLESLGPRTPAQVAEDYADQAVDALRNG